MDQPVKSVVIVCPGNVISGGVNSLHNLCRALTVNQFQASMYYLYADEKVLSNNQIKSYQVSRTMELKDEPDTLVIVPETLVHFLTGFTKARKMVYWLGLNYFFKNPTWRFPFNIKLFRKLISCRSYSGYSAGIVENTKRRLNEYAKSHLDIWNDQYFHLSNSCFVAGYCKSKGAPHNYVLHNPIRDEFYQHKISAEREKVILFGPKTPRSILALVKRKLPGFEIVRLKKMNIQRVYDLMSKAMIFAEFGNYSGRDRMPREAAMLGCVVFTNTRGTAGNGNDYKFPDYYRICDIRKNYPVIVSRMAEVVERFDDHSQKFEEFRQDLRLEHEEFSDNARRIFQGIVEVRI